MVKRAREKEARKGDVSGGRGGDAILDGAVGYSSPRR